MRRAAGWGVLLVLAASGCGTGEGPPGAADPSMVAAPQAPERFSFGAAADSARVAVWDVDVRPDGKGLPAGSGNVAAGAIVYQRSCAACHGPAGEGGSGNRLVGMAPWEDFPSEKSVGNYWPYATTLYDYIVRAMPQFAPGTLTADETYAVIAWILAQNGIIGEDAVMNATTLPTVVMPAKDRFVLDDRKGGPEVR